MADLTSKEIVKLANKVSSPSFLPFELNFPSLSSTRSPSSHIAELTSSPISPLHQTTPSELASNLQLREGDDDGKK